MRPWKRWTLGFLLAIVVALASATVVLWPRLRILSGTEGLAGRRAGVPAVAATIPEAVPGRHDWTAWRGAGNDGRSTLTGIRTDWSGGLRKLWEVDFLCQGAATTSWSAPVVRGNRLLVPGRDEGQDLLFGLDPATGELFWVGAYAAEARTSHGPGPRATPYIDDTRVYTFGRSGDLACWNIGDGRLLWRQDVSAFGGEEPGWGFASSPLVVEDRVIVQAGGSARTIAFDKTSGELLWKSGQGPAGYAAMALLEEGGRSQVVVFHGKGLAGLDPGDGAVLWDLPWETPYGVNATTPVVTDRGVLITSGYGRGAELVAVEGGAARVVWETQALAAQHSDPFVIDGNVYGYSGDSSQNRGVFKCLDLATGAERWSSSEIGWGTCTWVDGHLLCQDIHGNLALVRPDPAGLQVVSRLANALGETRGPVWTIPVVANGRLFLRFKQKLVAYDLAGGA